MPKAPVTASTNSASAIAASSLPPGMLMWAGMYAVLFTIAGGMIAYMYRPQ